MIKISIIVPVYNVEKYINQCIDSIVNQNQFDECELLLIDDGSTDNSGTICDEYSQKYNNIFCFHKQNGGISSARNYGLLKAKGEYILFIDSDDYIASKSISILLSEITKPFEVLLYNGILIDENNHLLNQYLIHNGLDENIAYIGKEAILKQLQVGVLQIVVWLGLYNRKFLLENKLFFENIWHEDELWTPLVLLKSSNIRYLDKIIYHYRIRKDSIQRSNKEEKHIKDLFYAFSILEKHYDDVTNQKLKLILKDNLVKKYLYVIYKWNVIKYPKLLKEIDKKKLMKWSYSKKNKMKLFLFCISPKFYSFIMRKIGEKIWEFTY